MGSRATFSSLRNRNYRLFFFGQLVSMAGTFMQSVAQSWLVLSMTDSGIALGFVVALQCLPILFFGPMAGVIIDRSDRRRLWMLTQSLSACTALILGLLAATDNVELWMIYVLAFTLGCITAIDQPTKISLLYDMVGPDDLTNAIGLNLALNQIGRVVGPALAGTTIAVLGVAPCFLLNSCSYLAVIGALLLMRPEELHRGEPVERGPRQVREGFAVVRRSPQLLSLLVAAAFFFGLAWSFEVVMPMLAKYTFGGGPATYGLMMSAIGLGSLVGALMAAKFGETSIEAVTWAGIAAGASFLAAALAPNIAVELFVLLFVGGSGTVFMTMMSSRLQLNVPSGLRGRVMSMWMIAAIGTRPFGSPIVGYVGSHLGPRYAVAIGAAGTLLLALPALHIVGRGGRPGRASERPPATDAAPALEVS